MPIILLQFSQAPSLKRFWDWWRLQLLPLIPEKVRQLLTEKNRFFISFTDAENVTIQPQASGQQINEATSLTVQELRLWRETAELPEDPVFILLLATGQYLRCRFNLPAAARENLNQVVGFELDRHTPFTAGQVYFAARITDGSAGKDQILVDVVLTPTNVLDEFVAKLQQAGIPLHQVTVAETSSATPEMGFNLLPPQLRAKPNRWRKALDLGLAGLLLILLILAVTIPVVRHNRTIQSLEEKANQARAAALRANKIKQELQQLEQQAHFVLDKKKASPPLITILEELSQRLPTDTWLTGFQYRDGHVNIDGKSPAASKLVELLEESPYLKNVHFVSPITQDRSSGLERFRISMEIVHEAASKTDG